MEQGIFAIGIPTTLQKIQNQVVHAIKDPIRANGKVAFAPFVSMTSDTDGGK